MARSSLAKAPGAFRAPTVCQAVLGTGVPGCGWLTTAWRQLSPGRQTSAASQGGTGRASREGTTSPTHSQKEVLRSESAGKPEGRAKEHAEREAGHGCRGHRRGQGRVPPSGFKPQHHQPHPGSLEMQTPGPPPDRPSLNGHFSSTPEGPCATEVEEAEISVPPDHAEKRAW